MFSVLPIVSIFAASAFHGDFRRIASEIDCFLAIGMAISKCSCKTFGVRSYSILRLLSSP
jgi:hypothetical protein